MREQEGAEGAPRKRAVEAEADDEQEERRRASRFRHRGYEHGERDAGEPERENGEEQDRLSDQERADLARSPKLGQGGERKDRAADGERGAAGKGDDAVVAHQHARRRDPVECEERCHDRERCPDQDGTPVAPAGADHGENDGGDGGGEGCDADAREVEVTAERDLVARKEVAGRRGKRRQSSAEDEDRSDPIAGTSPHASRMIGAARALDVPRMGVPQGLANLYRRPTASKPSRRYSTLGQSSSSATRKTRSAPSARPTSIARSTTAVA